MRKGGLPAAIAAVLMFLGFRAQAQMFNNFAGNMLMSRQALAPIARLRSNPSGGARQGPSVLGAESARALRTPPARTRTDYTRDLAVSARVRASFVDLVRRDTGEKAAQAVQADFKRHDPVELWLSQVAQDGYRPGDMGDALAAYIVLNWGAANRADVNRTQSTGLRRQVRQLLASDAQVARMGSADRQAFSEMLMCVFIYFAQDYRDALGSHDPARLRRVSDLAQARMVNDLGLDARAIRIGPNGDIVGG